MRRITTAMQIADGIINPPKMTNPPPERIRSGLPLKISRDRPVHSRVIGTMGFWIWLGVWAAMPNSYASRVVKTKKEWPRGLYCGVHISNAYIGEARIVKVPYCFFLARLFI